MRFPRHLIAGAAASALLLLGIGCGGETPTEPPKTTPAPAAIADAGGNAQNDTVGQRLPDSLAVRVTDASGSAVGNVPVTWTVTTGGGSVAAGAAVTSATGIARAAWTLGTTPGAQTVTASVAGVGQARTFTATAVHDRPATVVSVPDSLLFDAVGDSARPALTVRDRFGNVVAAPSFTYAGDAAVVAVGTSGFARAVGAGRVLLTITADTAKLALPVRVAPLVSTLGITGRTACFTALGDTARVLAAPKDANGNPVAGATVTWTSRDSNTVRVDAAGLLTARRNGQAWIVSQATTARAAKSDSTQVCVAQAVARVEASASIDTINALGHTRTYTAGALDARGSAITGATMTWSSLDPAVASATTAGVVTANAVGSARIVVTSGTAKDTVAVQVRQVAAQLAVTPEADTVLVGGSAPLAAAVTDSANAAMPSPLVRWSSRNAGIVTVDSLTGAVRGVAVGEAYVIARHGALSDSARILVQPVPVASVVVSPDSSNLFVRDTLTLSASVRDAAGQPLAGRVVAWTSATPTVVSVSASGTVTALAAGRGLVIATAEGRSDTAVVHVAGIGSACADVAHTLGTTVNGTWTTGDCRDFVNAATDRYAFTATGQEHFRATVNGPAGRQLRLRAQGSTQYIGFMPRAVTPEMNPVSVDYLLKPGAYVLEVSAPDSATLGSYTITTARQTSISCSALTFATPDVAITGTLESGDCLFNGALEDDIVVQLATGTRVKMTMTSTGFRPVAAIKDDRSQASPLLSREYRGTQGSVETSWTAQYSGGYVMIAAALAAGETGSYSLRIETVDAANTCVLTPTTLGGNILAGWESTDCRTGDAKAYDRYSVAGATTNFGLNIAGPVGKGLEVLVDGVSVARTRPSPTDSVFQTHWFVKPGSVEVRPVAVNTGGDSATMHYRMWTMNATNNTACRDVWMQRGASIPAQTLSATDCTFQSRSEDRVLVRLGAGETFTVAMTSAEFAPLLAFRDVMAAPGTVLVRDMRDAPGTARVSWTTTAAGVYEIIFTSTATGIAGTYTVDFPAALSSLALAPDTLSLTSGDTASLTATLRDTANAVVTGPRIAWTSRDTAVAIVDSMGLVTARAGGTTWIMASAEGRSDSTLVQVIAIGGACVSANHVLGGTVAGEWTNADCRDGQNRPVDRYVVTATGQEHFRVTVDGAAGRQMRVREQASGRYVGFQARAIAPESNPIATDYLLKAGTYVVEVVAPDSLTLGSYTMTTARQTSISCSVLTFATPDVELVGTLANGDCLFNGALEDNLVVQLDAGTRMQATLTSTGFRPVIAIKDDRAQSSPLLSREYAQAPGTVRTSWTAHYTGSYVAIAAALASGETGSYTWRLDRVDSANTCVASPYRLGNVTNAGWERADCQTGDAKAYDRFMMADTASALRVGLAGPAGKSLQVLVDGVPVARTRAVADTALFRTQWFLKPGAIELRPIAPNAGGDSATMQYRIATSSDTNITDCRDVWMQPGVNIPGQTLAATDCQFEGRSEDRILLRLPADTSITVEMHSSAFAPLVAIRDVMAPPGTVLARDARADTGVVRATITTTVAGVYELIASSNTTAVAGSYTLAFPPARIVARVVVSPDSSTAPIGGTRQLSAIAEAASGDTLSEASFVWSSLNASVATVDATGLVSGVSAGTARIVVSSSGKADTARVVVASPYSRIVIAPDTVTLTAVGQTQSYVATAYDMSDAPVSGVSFTWNVANPLVATLSARSGAGTTATADAAGTTQIFATAAGMTGAASLRVGQYAATINASPDTVRLAVGGAATLAAEARDANGAVMPGATVVWRAANGFARVDSTTGQVTAQSLGVGRIVARIYNPTDTVVSDTVQVVVANDAPPSLTFGANLFTVGRNAGVSIPIYLSTAPTAPVTLRLVSSDTAKGKFSAQYLTFSSGQTQQNAYFTATQIGTVTITATDTAGTYGSDAASVQINITSTLTINNGQRYSYWEGNQYYPTANQYDVLNTELRLSDPAPAGGLYFTITSGAHVTADPLTVFVPAGQLSTTFRVTANGPGSGSIVASAAGTTSASALMRVMPATFAFADINSIGRLRYTIGVGQLAHTNSGGYHVNMDAGVALLQRLPITFSISNPAVMTAPDTLSMPAGQRRIIVPFTALAEGRSLLSATAPGWTSETDTIIVTRPKVKLSNSNYGDSTYVGVARGSMYATLTDSADRFHPAADTVRFQMWSGDTTVVKVEQAAHVILPGQMYPAGQYVYMQAVGGGTTYIYSGAPGYITDSIRIKVAVPKIAATGWNNRVTASASPGFVTDNAIFLTLATPQRRSWVTFQSSDTLVAALDSTYFDPSGGGYTTVQVPVDIRSRVAGTATVIVSAPNHTPDTIQVVTNTARVRFSSQRPLPLQMFQAPASIQTSAYDSLGASQLWALDTTEIRIAVLDTTIVRMDTTTALVLPGQHFGKPFAVVPTNVGSTKLIVTVPNAPPDTVTVNVTGPQLNLGGYRNVLATNQTSSTGTATMVNVTIPATRTVPVVVQLTRRNPAISTLSADSVTIAAGQTSASFGWSSGTTLGVDTIFATAPGYAPDTFAIVVRAPKLLPGGFSGEYRPTMPPHMVNVAVGVVGDVNPVGATTIPVTVRVTSSNPAVMVPDSAAIHVQPGETYRQVPVRFISPGTARLIFTDSAGSYASDSSNVATVVAPTLTFEGHAFGWKLGMKQQSPDSTSSWGTMSTGVFVTVQDTVSGAPLVIAIASSDPRVVGVPASVTIPVGGRRAFLRLVSGDTTGAIAVYATADGFIQGRRDVDVSRAKVLTVDAPGADLRYGNTGTLYVSLGDSTNTAENQTAEDLVLNVASSDPSIVSVDSATVTVPAGRSRMQWSGIVRYHAVGTATITLTDPRTGFVHYIGNSRTVTVTNSTP